MTAYILHHNRYWTEYLDFLIDDTSQFPLVASKGALEDYNAQHLLSDMPPFDPVKHKTIITPGRLHDQTDHNFIVMRYQHSPGFYVTPLIKAYSELVLKHPTSDYRILVQEQYYRAMTMRDLQDPAFDHFRYQIMNDPKVERMEVDLMMYKIRDAKQLYTRQPNTGLLSLTWLMVDNDFSAFKNVIQTLAKNLQVNLLLHPLMRLEQNYLKALYALEGNLIGKIYYNLPRSELINLYDQHEYIITDGSGTCYEAMLRGCKPLAIRGIKKKCLESHLLEELDEEYLPFPSYEEINSSASFNSKSFIECHYPYLHQYSFTEAQKIAKNEIKKALPN